MEILHDIIYNTQYGASVKQTVILFFKIISIEVIVTIMYFL